MSDPTPADECSEECWAMAYAQLLGPLRPNATICAHKVRRVLDADAPQRMRIVR